MYDLNDNNRNNTITASTRLYTTNRAQPFHTDSADIVGLMCLQPAKVGGSSSIVSSSSIYNKIVDMRSDLACVLMEPMYNDRKGEVRASFFIVLKFKKNYCNILDVATFLIVHLGTWLCPGLTALSIRSIIPIKHLCTL